MTMNGLAAFYKKNSDKLLNNKELYSKLEYFNGIYNTKHSSLEILNIHIEEAADTLNLLKNLDLKKKRLLEIGGGVGLTYGYLKKAGVDIYTLEPAKSGFSSYYETGKTILKILNIDSANYLPLKAEEADKLNLKFDVVYSNYVIEHLKNFPKIVPKLKKILKITGIMMHRTYNYLFPYEPHFRIPLLPFKPELTAKIIKFLETSDLWKNLYFVNPFILDRIARANKLEIIYQKDAFHQALRRMDRDAEFRKRHKRFLPIFTFLKLTGLLKLVEFFPPHLLTPIEFQLKHTY